MITNVTVLRRVAQYIDALNANYAGRRRVVDALPDNPSNHTYFLDNNSSSSKYHRIVAVSYGQRSVHAFVDSDGLVYKPEGWKKPAKDARYDLLDDNSFASLLAQAQWAGGHLYVGGGTHLPKGYTALDRAPVVATVPATVDGGASVSDSTTSTTKPRPKSRKRVVVVG